MYEGLCNKADGDYKAWELSECAKQFYGAINCPERVNIDFFVGLRNKVEHRSMPILDPMIFGECQAFLFNFEDLLFKVFGSKHSLNESLSLALQFSYLRNQEQAEAIRRLHLPLAKNVVQYLSTFRSALSTDITNDLRYSYRIFIIPKTANSGDRADLAVEFVKYDPTKPEEMERYEHLLALIRPTVTSVVNPGHLKPGEVCKAVETIVQQVVGPTAKFIASYHHVKACMFYKIRPQKGTDPRKTSVQYCQYDEAHRDHVYTEEWKKFLMHEMRKPGQYERIIKG